MLPAGVHAVEVAVDPVHGDAIDAQPSAAVNPRTPRAGMSNLGVRTCDLLGEGAQKCDIQRGAVVQAEVDVGVRAVVTASSTAAQGDADDSWHGGKPLSQLVQACVVEHPGILVGDRARSNRLDVDVLALPIDKGPAGHLCSRP